MGRMHLKGRDKDAVKRKERYLFTLTEQTESSFSLDKDLQ